MIQRFWSVEDAYAEKTFEANETRSWVKEVKLAKGLSKRINGDPERRCEALEIVWKLEGV